MITQSKMLELFNYKDGVLYNKINRKKARVGEVSGTVSDKGYRKIAVLGNIYRSHRLIYLMHHGDLPSAIDHIDGNKLNNRIENLRKCTQSQNCYNSKMRKDNSAGVKGVYWSRGHKKYATHITAKGKRMYLGYFDDKEVAAQVVRIKRLELHGEFANHG